MVRQGQLQAESRVTDFGTHYLWFDPCQVEALRLERERRAAGSRPKGTPGPAPRPRSAEDRLWDAHERPLQQVTGQDPNEAREILRDDKRKHRARGSKMADTEAA